MPSTRRVIAPLLIAVPVVVAIAVALAARSGTDSGGDREPDPVVVEASDVVAPTSVADLAAAADCVAAGQVVRTERGRVVAAGLVTRLVHLRVDEALDGSCPQGTVVVEEEGWLADGAPVAVNGWPGTEEGDEGVWFLVAGTSDELPYASTVATSGALRWRDGEPVVPPDAPAWVLDATADGPGALADQVATAG